ncbi:uncharacterized protein TRIVIDRAFT_185782 [Trichoderma virens Gv29-8]|uniref:Uncharacterized protein n=1 Tax=Hypocrea virens (strain Gv29-8 / FGSC 10586) TaxID=413071 RepID=G9MIJ0_HYPVG|nr:uncharacterized protein TRIVIDRAFT_185782 [Trichoderma virens Gv29-8]EHK25307.1 hypothetical protein TRIVIDRAFT_185782 [Trichoderma virens Gv29-8]
MLDTDGDTRLRSLVYLDDYTDLVLTVLLFLFAVYAVDEGNMASTYVSIRVLKGTFRYNCVEQAF